MGKSDLSGKLPETGKLVDILISEEQKDAKNLSIPIPELIERWGWDWVCKQRQLTESFIEEWLENFDVKTLLENQIISLEFSSKIKDIIHYKLSKKNISHVYSNTTCSELSDMIKKIIRTSRDNDFRGGTVVYQILFSGLIGKKMYDNYPKNTKIRVRTAEHSKRAIANLIFEPKKVSNEIVILGNNAYNNTSTKIFII